MKSDPFISVENMDNAAIGKPVLFQRSAHGPVIHMGVDPQIAALGHGPIEDVGDQPLPPVMNGDSMDDAIRLVVEPAVAVDLQISWINVLNVGKHRADPPIFFANIKLTFGNIL